LHEVECIFFLVRATPKVVDLYRGWLGAVVFSCVRCFLRLVSNQSVRVFVVVTLAVASLAPSARADTIVSFPVVNGNSGDFDFILGQSVTTPGGGPWNNITFNFYNSSGAFATGNMYLLNQEYLGTPSALSSSTSGYLATGTATGGTAWVFDPSVTLQANIQYYFYMSSTNGTYIKISTDYADGNAYNATDTSSSYMYSVGSDVNFQLSGDPAPAPLPGAGLLSYLVVGCGALTALRKKLRARVSALFAVLKFRLREVAARKPGALTVVPS
jgi:hypothetical protein